MPADPATSRKSIYSVSPRIAMIQGQITRLKEKTGRTLTDWVKLVKESGRASDNEQREWLKKEHGLGSNYAWIIVEHVHERGKENVDPGEYLQAAEKYVEEMFAGGKAGLRPIYQALVELGLKQGKDVKVCPCQTIVPFYRNHVFAQIKPTTRTRIDLGFALGNMKTSGRLIDTGGYQKKDRITHRIEITSLKDIDDEVKRWLKTAYDLDA